MTIATADLSRDHRDAGTLNHQITNAVVMYGGARAALVAAGRVSTWTGVAGDTPVGFWGDSKMTGDTSATPIVNGRVYAAGQIVNDCPVAGTLAGTIADHQKFVYATTDVTFTITRPAAPNRQPVGIIETYKTTTTADVYFFSRVEMLQMALAGSNVRTICLGQINTNITASGNLKTGIVMSGHGKILDTYAICTRGQTDADADVDANLEIGGTNVTGGVIELITADVLAEKKSGTAITAANEFHDGDLLDVEGVMNTAGTIDDPGEYDLYITVEYLPGL